MTQWLVFLASFGALISSSAWLARRVREHRRYAVVLLFGLSTDIIVGERGTWGLACVLAAGPHYGAHRVLFHAATLAQSAWPHLLVMLLWRPLAIKARSAIALPWCVLNAASIALYPIEPSLMQSGMLANTWAAIVLGSAAVAYGWHCTRPSFTQFSIRALLAVEIINATVGPFRKNIFADWGLARFAYALAFAALTGLSLIQIHRSAYRAGLNHATRT